VTLLDSVATRLIFPQFRPPHALRPRARRTAGTSGVAIRWLGTAGFAIESRDASIVIDPYFTRAGFAGLLAPLIPATREISRRLPERIQAVLCGHSHFDHALDAPVCARLSGSPLVGSASTCAIGAAQGLPAKQLVHVPREGLELTLSEFEIRFVPSRHAAFALGTVPFPGEIASPATHPARIWDYRMGGAFGIFVRAGDLTIYHNGSADLVDAELLGRHADVLLVGLAGRQATPRYLERLLGALRPAVVVPAHHDSFFTPLEAGVRLLPTIDFFGFVAEVKRLSPASQVVAPLYEETLWVTPGARDAFLLDGNEPAAL
jgi:L-ascorbate metabolism protein UlaG (beta-lactamase superfamily)